MTPGSIETTDSERPMQNLSDSDVAVNWIEADEDYKNAGKVSRAADKRRKTSAAEFGERGWVKGNRIAVEDRGIYAVDEATRTNPSYKDAWDAFISTLAPDDPQRELLATILSNNTNVSKTPKLKAVTIN